MNEYCAILSHLSHLCVTVGQNHFLKPRMVLKNHGWTQMHTDNLFNKNNLCIYVRPVRLILKTRFGVFDFFASLK